MKLSIKDRVIILNTVLPSHATREILKSLVMPIIDKLKLTSEEQSALIVHPSSNGITKIDYTKEAIEDKMYEFTSDELNYLKDRIALIDQSGMFSLDTVETYDKILDYEP